MFSFFKKEKRIPLPSLKIDLHSHLIPGIDDGSKSIDESISLLKGMEILGYQKIITTPHIMTDAYRNTPEIITAGLKKLKNAAQINGIQIEIEAAAEYYFDDGFLNLLKKNEILSINNRYLLFETSYISKPLQIEEMIFEITSSGYTPVMAHPERYHYIKDPLQEYKRFQKLGVLFQVNLNSFGGYYGKSAKTLADFLSHHGMISFLGSDLHHHKHLNSLQNILNSSVYKKIFEKNNILNDELI
jgi:tyrosine-protein phosphatase YwqE